MSSLNNPSKPPKEIVTGSFAGDDGDNRQITTGFKCSLVIATADGAFGSILIPNQANRIADNIVLTGGTQLHATDGFSVYQTGDNMNAAGKTYYWWAISE